jgi:hypothetical protein
MMFYVGFLVAELPTQFLAQRISGLGKYLGSNIMFWGRCSGQHGGMHLLCWVDGVSDYPGCI